MKRLPWGAGFMLLVYPASAWAHLVNPDVGEFYAGMLHPLTSVEHFLPAVVVALLAGRQGLRGARWTLLAFPAALILGTWAGNSLLPSPELSQISNFVLIILLGMMLVSSRDLPLSLVITGAVLTGLILGWRSSIDMANAGVSFRFIPGVGVTGFLLIALISPWIANDTSPGIRTAMRLTGGVVILVGVYFLGRFLGGGVDGFRNIGLPTEDSLTALVRTETLSIPVITGAILAATAWGASHALTPGHGKALVGAYLIGSRGTPMHAVYLGLTVTATHTMGVIALGVVALLASKYLLPEQLTPWLALVSGLIVIIIGATLFYKRFIVTMMHNNNSHHHSVHSHGGHEPRHHDHDHHHTHDHDHDHTHGHGHDHHSHSHLPPGTDGAAVTWRSLLALGVSGGLIPCPAALVLLLSAISIGRIGFGILLVIAFSFGLAAVLMLVGMLFIKGSLLLDGIGHANKLKRYAPGFSALFIIGIGVFITVEAVAQLMI